MMVDGELEYALAVCRAVRGGEGFLSRIADGITIDMSLGVCKDEDWIIAIIKNGTKSIVTGSFCSKEDAMNYLAKFGLAPEGSVVMTRKQFLGLKKRLVKLQKLLK